MYIYIYIHIYYMYDINYYYTAYHTSWTPGEPKLGNKSVTSTRTRNRTRTARKA